MDGGGARHAGCGAPGGMRVKWHLRATSVLAPLIEHQLRIEAPTHVHHIPAAAALAGNAHPSWTYRGGGGVQRKARFWTWDWFWV